MCDLRLAQPDELDTLCARMAAIDPWTRLEITAEALIKATRQDPLRQTWVMDDGGELASCIMFRTTHCCQLLCERKMAGPLIEKLGLPPDTPPETLPDGAYVNALAVFPGHQSKGAGYRLLAKAEEIAAQESTRIYLCVSEANPRARAFYERNGYHLIGNIPNCIRPGNTEHLMVKELNPGTILP